MIERIGRLTADAKPLWGRMSVEQMLSHLVQAQELPFESTVADRSNWMSRNIVKTLVLTVVPVPKEVKTSAELDQQQGGRKPLGFEVDKANVIESLNKIGNLDAGHKCLAHPFFGPLSAKQWARIGYKHMDHHLRQFGV